MALALAAHTFLINLPTWRCFNASVADSNPLFELVGRGGVIRTN